MVPVERPGLGGRAQVLCVDGADASGGLVIKWPDAAAKTRTSTVDALATAGTGFVRDATGGQRRPIFGEY